MSEAENIIEVVNLKNELGEVLVHNNLNLAVKKGEIIAIIGPSGCGKTTLFRSILMLHQPTAGQIKVFGKDTLAASDDEVFEIRKQMGVMFQSGALFSSLSVLENIMYPLAELTSLHAKEIREIAFLKIVMVGLEMSAATKFPAELSGGMRKRAAVARSLALDPKLLFLDEPTAGLDPKSAGELDDLVLHLRDNLGITIVMITHDLDTLWRVPDRVVYLGEGKVLAAVSMAEMEKQEHPLIHQYFSGPRADTRAKLAREG